MLVYAASADPDTMYYHEAMREPDRAEFIKAMEKEVKSHTENRVWELVPRSSVPPGIKILPAVWAMRRKRRIATREVLSLMELVQEMQDHGCGLTATTPSAIISGTRFKMALSPFILPQQKTCSQTSSPKSAMKRLTPSCASN